MFFSIIKQKQKQRIQLIMKQGLSWIRNPIVFGQKSTWNYESMINFDH